LLVRLARRLAQKGYRAELALSGRLGPPDAPPSPAWPIPMAVGAPRVIVGAAGYNLVYEACAARAAHLAIPLPRRFDDQHRRARALCEVPPSPEALEARAIALLEGAPSTRRELIVRSHDELARHVVRSERG
jgi:hypothetical protein